MKKNLRLADIEISRYNPISIGSQILKTAKDTFFSF